jgi:hypothetical protein
MFRIYMPKKVWESCAKCVPHRSIY